MSQNKRLPTTPSPPRRAASGFTLVELLIVVALMGIVAAVILPRMEGGMTGHLEAAGSILVTDLDYARQLAIANQSSYAVEFAANGERYTITHSGSNSSFDTLPSSAFRRPNDPPDQHICRFADLPQSGLRLRFWALDPPGAGSNLNRLQFDSLGSLASGADSTIWIAATSGRTRFFVPVSVSAATGLATVGEITSADPLGSETSSEQTAP